MMTVLDLMLLVMVWCFCIYTFSREWQSNRKKGSSWQWYHASWAIGSGFLPMLWINRYHVGLEVLCWAAFIHALITFLNTEFNYVRTQKRAIQMDR